jgi:hypothetical protein
MFGSVANRNSNANNAADFVCFETMIEAENTQSTENDGNNEYLNLSFREETQEQGSKFQALIRNYYDYQQQERSSFRPVQRGELYPL